MLLELKKKKRKRSYYIEIIRLKKLKKRKHTYFIPPVPLRLNQ
jgi:hypothetical protein